MKFLHTADIHLGKSRSLPGYLERQDKMMHGIFSTARQEKVSHILIVGDVVDRKDVNPKEKDLLLKYLCDADRDGIKTVLINGNHDQYDEQYTHLHFLTSLVKTGRLQNTTIVEIEPKLLKVDDKTYIIAVPAKYYKGEEVNTIVSFFIKKIYEQIDELNIERDDLTIIAMVHETVYGSVNDDNFAFKNGAKLDKNLPVTYWALGDIHTCQSIPGLPHAWFSGSPVQHDFGDADNKCVLIVDTLHPTKPKKVKLPGIKPLVTLTEAPKVNEDWPDAYIRFAGTAETLANTKLPNSVVKVKPLVSEEEAISFLQKDDLLDGLIEILASQGLTKEEQELAMLDVQKLRSDAGV